MNQIVIVNGPNLNLLGQREQDVYGHVSFEAYLKELRDGYRACKFSYYQSNIEGELIDILHQVGFSVDGIVFNAGAYTHTSIALADAIRAISTPVVEVHISNVFAREKYRHISLIGSAVIGSISGFGLDSYRLAVEALLAREKS